MSSSTQTCPLAKILCLFFGVMFPSGGQLWLVFYVFFYNKQSLFCSYPRAIKILKEGKVDLKSLIAAKFPLTKTNDAFKATAKGLTTGFKVIIDCTDTES